MSILIAIALAAAMTWLASINAPTPPRRDHPSRSGSPGPRSTTEPPLITDMLGGACALGVVIASRAGRSDQPTPPKRRLSA